MEHLADPHPVIDSETLQAGADELHQLGVDVERQVAAAGGEWHPRDRQRVQAAGDVENGRDLAVPRGEAGEDFAVELLQHRQTLAGRGVLAHRPAQDVEDPLPVAVGQGRVEVVEEALVARSPGQVGTEDLVQAALGPLGGVAHLAALDRQGGGRLAPQQGLVQGSVPLAFAEDRHDLVHARIGVGEGGGHGGDVNGRRASVLRNLQCMRYRSGFAWKGMPPLSDRRNDVIRPAASARQGSA